MDHSLWQTLGSFGFLCSSHMWFFKPYCRVRNTAQQCRLKTNQEPSEDSNAAQRSWIMQRRFCFFKREVFSIWCDALHLWGQRSSDQDDHQGHRVALDLLFDRINLDPKMCIKYVDTKNQLADIQTKGNFTRDEWNNLLHLFNISILSTASCPEAMSKVMQQGTGEERVVAKSKPTLNLVSHTAVSFPAAPSSSASSRPGILRAPSQQGPNLVAQKCRETCRWRFNSKWRSVKFLSVANRCKVERTCEERTRIKVFKNVHGNLPQKIPTSTTRTTRSGRTITASLVTFHTSRKSTRNCDNNWNASQKKKWRTSMWIRWYGECLWLSLNKPQFILEAIIWIIYIQPKISHKEQWNNCSMWQEGCSNMENEFKSYHNKTNRFCTDAGFLTVVEIGQYFMTKDTAEFSQFTDAVACREHILPRDEEASQPKLWIRGNTKIGPVLEVATCCLHGKYGGEIRVMSISNRQFSLLGQNFSWLKQVGHEFEQRWAGNLRCAVRRICVEIECEWFGMPIKGQSKTTKTRTCRFVHKNNIFVKEDYLEKMMERLNSGESKTIFRHISCIVIIGLTRRRKQEKIPVLYSFTRSNLVLPSSSRSFRTQSHWSFSTRQCDYSEQLLPMHLSCRMCNQFTFHHQFGIDTWRSEFEQQTDSILSACGSHGQKP